jgi:hypothetical protein
MTPAVLHRRPRRFFGKNAIQLAQVIGRMSGQKSELFQWLALRLRFAAEKDGLPTDSGASRVRLHEPDAPSRELLTGGAARDALGRADAAGQP